MEKQRFSTIYKKVINIKKSSYFKGLIHFSTFTHIYNTITYLFYIIIYIFIYICVRKKNLDEGRKNMITEFNCDKNILLENLSIVLKAVSSKNILPQLESFYIEAWGENITLIGTNSEILIKTKIEADIKKDGKFLINAKNFFDMIRLMPEGEIYIGVSDDYVVSIKNGKTVYEIMGLSTESYPLMENFEGLCKFSIKEKDLKEAVRKTSFAIGTDEKKPTFMGALFEIKNSLLKVVTLDGYRLAIISKPINTDVEYDSYIVPGKSLNELLKILVDSENEVTVEFGERGAVIKIGDFEFFTRLIEGEFFNYDQIIPKKFLIEAICDRRKFTSALERCSLIITPDSKVPVKFNIYDNVADISTVSRIGKIEDSIEVNKNGENIEIGFNHKFLLDIFKSLEEDYIIMNFTNNLSPCIIKSTENEEFLYLVLPVRLK